MRKRTPMPSSQRAGGAEPPASSKLRQFLVSLSPVTQRMLFISTLTNREELQTVQLLRVSQPEFQGWCLDSHLMQSFSFPGSKNEPIRSAHTESLMPALEVVGNYDRCTELFPSFQANQGKVPSEKCAAHYGFSSCDNVWRSKSSFN